MSEDTDKKPAAKKNSVAGVIVGIIVAIVLAWYFLGGGLNKQAARDMQKIENQVATDAVKQYEIAKTNGSAMDAYVQAGLVCASFLQAKDEENYKKWKAIEKQEAVRAGMPTTE
jgi:hypothetical protein